MKVARQLMIIIFTVNVLVTPTGGSLSFKAINSVDGSHMYECGSNVTFKCHSDTTPSEIGLRIKGYQAVVCSGECFVNTGILGKKYTITHSYADGLINLHIPYISNVDENITFECKSESASATIRPVIRDQPKRETSVMKSVEDKDTIKIIVTTGCTILRDPPRFLWFKAKERIGTPNENLLEHDFEKLAAVKKTSCELSHDCNGASYTNVMQFRKLQSGEEYYIGCAVVTGVSSFTLVSDLMVKIRVAADDRSGISFPIGIWISVLCSVPALILYLRHSHLYNGLPYPPTNLTVQPGEPADSTVILTWHRDNNGGYDQHFLVRWRETGQNKWTVSAEAIPDSVADLNVTSVVDNLSGDRTYEFSVAAVNKLGCSLTRTTVTYQMPGLYSAGNISIVQESLTHESVTVKWDFGDNDMYPREVSVRYRTTDAADWQEQRQTFPDGFIGVPVQRIDNLSPGKEYDFEVGVKGDAGEPLTENPLRIRTKGLPEKPTDLKYLRDLLSSNSVTLTWRAGNNGGYEQRFIIRYKQQLADANQNKTRWKAVLVPLQEGQPFIQHEVVDLMSGTSYKFKICAENVVGCSVMDESLQVATMCNPPKTLSVTRKDARSAELTWTYDGNGVQKFVVRYQEEGQQQKVEEVQKPKHHRNVKHEIRNLKPGTTYVFEVATVNIDNRFCLEKVTYRTPDESRCLIS